MSNVRTKKRPVRKLVNRLALGLLLCIPVGAYAQLVPVVAATTTVTPTPGLSCDGYRTGTSNNCTSGEFVVQPTAVAVNSATGDPLTPSSCILGQPVTANFQITLSGQNTDRYNIGLFVGEGGNIPSMTTAAPNNADPTTLCSVASFPTSVANVWTDNAGTGCGDLLKNAAPVIQINNVTLQCADNGSGNLAIPLTITDGQNTTAGYNTGLASLNGSNACGKGNVQAGTTAKCTSGTIGVTNITTTTPVKLQSFDVK